MPAEVNRLATAAAPVDQSESAPVVAVRGSATFELEWALWLIKRATNLGQTHSLGPEVSISRPLARRVTEFWRDGSRMFTEIAVLADQSESAYEMTIESFMRHLDRTVASAATAEPALASEPPEERAAITAR